MADQILSNYPPTDADPLRDRLTNDYAAALERRDELLDAMDRVPNPISDDEQAGKVSDYVKLITGHTKEVEKFRVAEKEPYLKATRTVDGWFKGITEPLGKAKKDVEKILTDYQLKKAAEERRRREEEERRAREEADRLRREAEQKAEAAQNESQLQDAIETGEDAVVAEAQADKAAKAVDVKPAELSRTRGEEGAVASLRRFWDFRNLDRETLDLETLRHHLPEEALKQAVRSYVKAGGRKLEGVEIFENAQTTVR